MSPVDKIKSVRTDFFSDFESTSDNKDEINAVELSDSTIGYYQSTTCKISLLEFYSENLESDKNFYINENNKSKKVHGTFSLG